MANELVHGTCGTSLTQAEFEAVGLHVLNSQATGDLIYASSATQLSRLGVGTNGDFLTLTAGVPAWTSNKATTMYIGDTANTGMTLGLTINQGAADNEILAFKSSDVAHGMTDYAETDTYGTLAKYGGAYGGVKLTGFGNTNREIGVNFLALAGVDDVTKASGSLAYLRINVGKKSGTNYGAPGANANIAEICANGAVKFLLDLEGSLHLLDGIVCGLGEGNTTGAGLTGGKVRAPHYVGGTTSDVAGADLTIQAGQGTGIGDVGQIIFQTPRVQASGSTVHTLTTIMTLDEAAVTISGTFDAGTSCEADAYSAGGTAGVATFGPGAVTSITVKQGIITAIS